ncbi:MAG: hypothetical protein A2041_14015 [Bacteroidetes bacterium GWA2_31_9b]|nr:MAG: hypothetical protein A2041_14015 [Bacteroidetes bacterium GWA2_31_9b]
MECIQEFYIHNKTIKKSIDFDEQVYVSGISVYEIIRIEQAIPLFIEDHLLRIYNSAKLSGLKIIESDKEIENKVRELIQINKVNTGKIKILIHFNSENSNLEKDLLIYFTSHYFPTLSEYRNGVQTGICKAVRTNPNAKIHNTLTRQKANHIIAEKKLFEVILVDNEGYITEGSRSNVFYILGESIITPPMNDVLSGITRKNIQHICIQNKIPFIEKKIHFNDVTQFDAMFLSGTSLKVLPVRSFDEIKFEVNNNMLIRLLKFYNEHINSYIKRKKTSPAS